MRARTLFVWAVAAALGLVSFAAFGADGRIPIPGGTSERLISAPGSYYLTGDITTGDGAALAITASDVTLDLLFSVLQKDGVITRDHGERCHSRPQRPQAYEHGHIGQLLRARWFFVGYASACDQRQHKGRSLRRLLRGRRRRLPDRQPFHLRMRFQLPSRGGDERQLGPRGARLCSPCSQNSRIAAVFESPLLCMI